MRVRYLVSVAALAVAMLASGCGSSDDGGGGSSSAGGDEAATAAKTVDLGGGVTPKVGEGELKIAYFSAGSNNVYLQAGIKAAKETATKLGAKMTVFDAAFDANKQFSQVQNATARKQFNAYVMEAVDPQQMCNGMRTAAKQDILISVINAPICGRATNEGEAVWEPGTVNFVGGTQTRDAFTTWLDKIASENSGPQKAAILMGPELGANTQNTDLAVKAIQEKHPEFKIVSNQKTDYSLPQGQAKAQNILQANPDLTVLIANYSDLTRGALQAVKQANRDGKVKVYDYGANRWAVDAVKKGDVALTGVMLPYTEVQRAVEALAQTWKGERPEKFADLAKDETVPGTLLIDKANVAEFEPEY
jgi:ribose transport system substrate-binding protein